MKRALVMLMTLASIQFAHAGQSTESQSKTAGITYDALYKNYDNSTTFVNPRLLVQGDYLAVLDLEERYCLGRKCVDNVNGKPALCRRLLNRKEAKVVWSQSKPRQRNQALVVLESDRTITGTIIGAIPANLNMFDQAFIEAGHGQLRFLTDITCR
jgi:hypothetical protein